MSKFKIAIASSNKSNDSKDKEVLLLADHFEKFKV